MKKTLLGIIIGILVGTASSVLASTLLASNIAYTPKDSTWGVNNVEAAIDSLKLSKTSDNYSTDEKVVGTWIDGKPLYQKTLYFTSSQMLAGENKYSHNIANVKNIRFKYDASYLHESTYGADWTLMNSNTGNYYFMGVWCDKNDISINISQNVKNRVLDGDYMYITLEYTKTTD